jgi:hypothetical protein
MCLFIRERWGHTTSDAGHSQAKCDSKLGLVYYLAYKDVPSSIIAKWYEILEGRGGAAPKDGVRHEPKD